MMMMMMMMKVMMMMDLLESLELVAIIAKRVKVASTYCKWGGTCSADTAVTTVMARRLNMPYNMCHMNCYTKVHNQSKASDNVEV